MGFFSGFSSSFALNHFVFFEDKALQVRGKQKGVTEWRYGQRTLAKAPGALPRPVYKALRGLIRPLQGNGFVRPLKGPIRS